EAADGDGDGTDVAVAVGVPYHREEGDRRARACGLEALPLGRGFCVIWTAAPWTLPADQALNLHPEIEYALVRTDFGGSPCLLLLAAERAAPCLERWGLAGELVARCPGKAP